MREQITKITELQRQIHAILESTIRETTDDVWQDVINCVPTPEMLIFHPELSRIVGGATERFANGDLSAIKLTIGDEELNDDHSTETPFNAIFTSDDGVAELTLVIHQENSSNQWETTLSDNHDYTHTVSVNKLPLTGDALEKTLNAFTDMACAYASQDLICPSVPLTDSELAEAKANVRELAAELNRAQQELYGSFTS